MNKTGFTLIEVMISVAIVAVLATLALIAYSGVQRRGRDAKRQNDLKIIQAALEQYHTDQNSYPQALNDISTSSPKYLSLIPTDPQPIGGDYCYQANCSSSCLSYTLYTNLETSSMGNYSCSGKNYNFKVISP